MRKIYVTNYQGDKEPFSFNKVYQSARRVGASKKSATQIAGLIETEVYPGMATREIFNRVRELLKKEYPSASLKFSLKKGIKRLGPTGFPFEKYIGEIFSHQGFEVKINQYIRGQCLRYEIDFLARKGNLLYIGECKYRNQTEGLVHSGYALINYARFLDIQKGKFYQEQIKKGLEVKSILVTNTRFSRRAVKYSRWAGVDLLGWRYPGKRGLEYLIDSQRLYPITILPSLRKNLANFFASRRIMLIEDILKLKPERFSRINRIPLAQIKSLVREARTLMS